ncbi:MAG: Ig-like domain-containing protein, partial [Acidimicrobiia bacterium]
GDGVASVNATLASSLGSVTIDSQNRIVFNPKPGSTGTVIFNYTVTDADGDPSSATVSVTVGQ